MGNLKALVIDRDAEAGRRVVRLLKAEGHRACALTRPYQALQELRRARYDVVLADSSHGRGDCRDPLLDWLPRASEDAAVIVMTAQPSVDAAVGAAHYGAAGYLLKPLDPAALREALQRIMRQKGLVPTTELDFRRCLGVRLRDARKARSLTLAQVSKRSGLSIGLISKVERARSSISLPSLFSLSQALHAKISDLTQGF